MTDEEIINRVGDNIIGSSIEEAISQYRSLPHFDYEFDGGAICICELPDFYFIAFAWCDNTIQSRKNFLRATQEIYINSNKPFLFSGKKNYFKSRSVEICKNVWKCTPKVV